MPFFAEQPAVAPDISESPELVLALAILVAFSIYLILRSKRKTAMATTPQNSDANEEIDDVKKASAEGFGSNEQVFPPSAAFVAKARVKGMDGYEALYRRSIKDPDGF